MVSGAIRFPSEGHLRGTLETPEGGAELARARGGLGGGARAWDRARARPGTVRGGRAQKEECARARQGSVAAVSGLSRDAAAARACPAWGVRARPVRRGEVRATADARRSRPSVGAGSTRAGHGSHRGGGDRGGRAHCFALLCSLIGSRSISTLINDARRPFRGKADRPRDRSEIAPRSLRDHPEITPRSLRDRSEITPRSLRDRSEITPRSLRDHPDHYAIRTSIVGLAG